MTQIVVPSALANRWRLTREPGEEGLILRMIAIHQERVANQGIANFQIVLAGNTKTCHAPWWNQIVHKGIVVPLSGFVAQRIDILAEGLEGTGWEGARIVIGGFGIGKEMMIDLDRIVITADAAGASRDIRALEDIVNQENCQRLR